MVRTVAKRIEDAVVRGEIDNTVEGRTTGWLWLLGRSDPVTLDLAGDCWRDLAGAKLRFRNPEPDAHVELASVQRGVVGDMSASRKIRMPLCALEDYLAMRAAGEEVEEVWKNMLSLEWFSETDGRVVLETADFELELSEHCWAMDADAELAQKMANLQAMRDFLEQLVGRCPGRGDDGDWEHRLKESDRLTDAYQEVLDKYFDDPDAERKEAFVMGWDDLLQAMAEGGGTEPLLEEQGWVEEPELDEMEALEEVHPLQEDAEDLALRAHDLLRREDRQAVVLSPLNQVASRLAGALSGVYEKESGYVVAVLKRCLLLQGDALSGIARLAPKIQDADQRRAVGVLRDELLDLRERLADLCRELRGI